MFVFIYFFIINDTAVNILEHISSHICARIPLGCILRS